MAAPLTSTGQNQRLAAAFAEQRGRLRAFVRRQVADVADAEDIVQEVFYELVLAERLMRPVEQLAGWLRRVARNRIVDRFRARSREAAVIDRPSAGAGEREAEGELDEDPRYRLGDLPAPGGGPEADYARAVLLEELEAALSELPREQREVFMAHELEGRTFCELAAADGVSVNTLLGRKHAAVLHLRERLRALYEEFEL